MRVRRTHEEQSESRIIIYRSTRSGYGWILGRVQLPRAPKAIERCIV